MLSCPVPHEGQPFHPKGDLALSSPEVVGAVGNAAWVAGTQSAVKYLLSTR